MLLQRPCFHTSIFYMVFLKAIEQMKKEQADAIEWAKGKQEAYLRDTKDLQSQLAAAKQEAVQQVHTHTANAAQRR